MTSATTNKKKKNMRTPAERQAVKQKRIIDQAMANVKKEAIPQIKPFAFTNGQLTSLIFLSVGISRIMQIRSSFANFEHNSATQIENNSTDPFLYDNVTTTTVASKICLEYLGTEDVCINDSINTLLRFKHFTSIQTCFIVSFLLAQIWSAENVLQKLNSLFVICPIGTGMTALYIVQNPQYGVISSGVFLQQLLMCIVLTVISNSGWQLWKQEYNIPRGTGTNYYQSLPNLSLLFLSGMSLYDAIQVMQGGPELGNEFSLIQLAGGNTNDLLHYWYAARPILYFISNDKITNCFMYTYAWYFLNDNKQRNFLLSLCLNKLGEYFYQLPLFDEVFLNVSSLRTTALVTATICGLASMAPEIRWKRISHNLANQK